MSVYVVITNAHSWGKSDVSFMEAFSRAMEHGGNPTQMHMYEITGYAMDDADLYKEVSVSGMGGITYPMATSCKKLANVSCIGAADFLSNFKTEFEGIDEEFENSAEII